VEQMIAQRFVIMLFVEFTFCYFAGILTWLKHTYVTLCSDREFISDIQTNLTENQNVV